jgi:hypothetical protein
MVGALGITVGHVASAVAQPAPAASLTATGLQSFQSGRNDGGALQVVRPRAEWDI